jgi:uncharacterized protein YbcV (DUF1398 family)
MPPMTQAAIRTAEHVTKASDAAEITFPQVLDLLIEAGIERYHADLVRHEKTYFTADGASHVTPCKAHAPDVAVDPRFSAADVEAAIRASQSGRIDYAEFCRRMLRAGCAGYFVTLHGRRAVYYGRSGETFVEAFPSAVN